MEKWTVIAKKADFKAIGEEFGIDPVIARIIRNRDIVGSEAVDEYLHGGRERLRDPFLLKDMDRASEILSEKIRLRKKIRIIGDYDIDGIMSSYILKRGIVELQGDADIRIPNRIADGYGMNPEMVREALKDGIDTIVTCDNGISAREAVDLAVESGMTVIVTDHHEVAEIPGAQAVIDPKRPDDTSPNKDLCGAGVAWKLVRALGGDDGYDLLQYAAFATVGDIVNLTGENRVIVREGIRQLRETDNVGLNALAAACSIDMASVGTYHIGFILGPCLNASGRLDTAMRAVELLEAGDPSTAAARASELKALNDSRKSMTEKGTAEATAVIESGRFGDDRVLVVFLPGIHESVAGIIAGRLREKYAKPVFVLTHGENLVKGSGRSVESYHMFEELRKADDLLIRFGGHAMAAGLSLEEGNIDALRERLNGNCTLTEDDLCARVRIDVPMPISYITEELIGQLELLEPFGKGNEKPLFAQKNVFCDHVRIFGASHNFLKMRVRSLTGSGDAYPDRIGFQPLTCGPEYDAVCFGDVDELAAQVAENPVLTIAYEPQINEYMGQRRIQLVIRHYMPGSV